MGMRREGREAAIQFLYQLDINARNLTGSNDDFWLLRTDSSNTKPTPKLRAFAEQLVAGVTQHIEAIDDRIKTIAANYELHRIAAVDRNILRVAIYEMLFTTEVPPVVSINEAIEIAKRFSGEESGKFVNGILDKIRASLPRPARVPMKETRSKG